MNGRPLYIGLVLLVVSESGISQIREEKKEQQIEQAIEAVAESEETDIDNSVMLEDMARFSENPVNINMATAAELERLSMLDFRQVQNIINYRKQYGYFVSVFELGAVEGFTPETIALLSPFLTFDIPSDSTGNSRKKIFHRMLTRVKTTFPEANGYRSVDENKGAVYPGKPLSLYNRYMLDIPDKLEVGLIADNDPGEEFFSGSNPRGFDFYSGFIALKSNGLVRQVTVGDFLLRIGQGLNFGAGTGLGKSGNVMGIMKSGQGIRPSTSADENRFFRGVTATLGTGALKMMFFYSNKKRDADTVSEPGTGTRYFTSLQTSGYHRTVTETANEKTLGEQVAGGYAEMRFSRFRIGTLFVQQQFALPMLVGSSPYKAKNFSGDVNFNLGLDYQWALPRLQLFGEAGLSKSMKPAVIQGLVWHAHPQLSLAVYYRYFDAGFHTFYGSSLAESSGNRNESGLYTGLLLYPLAKIKISAYVDIYKFPWLTYTSMSPGFGSDFMTQCDISLSRKFSLYLKAKYETKPHKVGSSTGVSADQEEINSKVRLHTEYNLNRKLTLRTRFEYAGYSFSEVQENGFLVFQDLIYTPSSWLKCWVRYGWFNTDGFNSRIYTFENDLLYTFSIPEFHGRGHRVYLNLKLSPSSRSTVYLKAGGTIHEGASSWGTGSDMTAGNHRLELRGLLYLRF